MAYICKTQFFTVEAFDTPHVSREEGGHIRIVPKEHYLDRSEMPAEVAKEFIFLTMVMGQALKNAMANRGVEIMRINYHDMGNWAFKTGKQPFFHMHIYGRAKNAVKQPYMEAVYLPDRSTGFYKDFEPLNQEDIAEIRKEIDRISKEEKYQDNVQFEYHESR